MSAPSSDLPPRLAEIVTDFQLCEGREKIELLLEFAEKLPPLPGFLQAERSRMDEVPECMTPVFVFAERQADGLRFFFDVPPESPTVRGFAAIMQEGMDKTTPEQVLSIPGDFFLQMGLHQVLTHQRLNGIAAILAHMKQLAVKEISA
jgi:cysteine desulfuration protein SufE